LKKDFDKTKVTKMNGWDYKKYGRPFAKIDGSLFYRAYCPDCGEPVRITREKAEARESIYCIDCSPPHQGCSSPPCKNDDIDEFSSSYRIATRNDQ